MSRFSDYEGDGDDAYNGNGGAMWEKRAELALRGKRGRKALTELREALVALPEHRLVESVMCQPRTAGGAVDAEIVGYDVCVIGAYVWHQKVKGGMDPVAAFDAVPRITQDDESNGEETARIGKSFGLTYTLAWELAHQNDEDYSSKTPEQRHAAFLAWIDEELRRPPLKAAPRRPKREPGGRSHRRLAISGGTDRRPVIGALPMEMGL